MEMLQQQVEIKQHQMEIFEQHQVIKQHQMEIQQQLMEIKEQHQVIKQHQMEIQQQQKEIKQHFCWLNFNIRRKSNNLLVIKQHLMVPATTGGNQTTSVVEISTSGVV